MECLQVLSQRYVGYRLFPIQDHRVTHRFKLRYHFGPTVHLRSVVLAATEALVGTPYDGNDINLYRLESDRHIEFLDVEKESVSANLVQPLRDLFNSLVRCLLTL